MNVKILFGFVVLVTCSFYQHADERVETEILQICESTKLHAGNVSNMTFSKYSDFSNDSNLKLISDNGLVLPTWFSSKLVLNKNIPDVFNPNEPTQLFTAREGSISIETLRLKFPNGDFAGLQSSTAKGKKRQCSSDPFVCYMVVKA